MTRILVTAALGNVGREVVRACADRGFTVRAGGRDESVLRASFPAHELARLDFFDRSTWASALADCDHVFLLRPPPIGDMKATLHPFVDAAYAAGVRHIVFLSVAGADRMKWVPHRKVELHLAATGKSWTLLRPGFFAQNFEDAYRLDIVEDARIYVPAADARVAFIDVRDIAAVAARVFEHPEAFRGEQLTLTGPEAVTFDDVARELTAALGRPIRYEAASLLGYVHHLRRRRHLPWMQILIQTILHRGLRGGDAEAVDPTVEKVLGRPARSMRDYVDAASARWASPSSTPDPALPS